MVVEREGHGRALIDAELADRGEVLAAQLDRGAQLERVGAGDGADPELLPAHPRHDRAIAEAHDQLHAHRHMAAHAAHQPDHVDVVLVVGERHEVGHRDHAFSGLERGLEDRGAGQIAALGAADLALRRDQPAPVLGRAEQRGEAGVRIEVRQAEPVDRPVTPDQGPDTMLPMKP